MVAKIYHALIVIPRTRPVSISYSKLPKLHQSTAFPYPFPSKISGAALVKYIQKRELKT